MNKQGFQIGGSLLARNTVLNFIGLSAPIFVALLVIPYTIKGLGVDRFGVLSLAFLIVGYFSLFDIGLGRATIKFVSEAFGRGDYGVMPAIIWTSLSIQLVLGVVGGAALFIFVPLIVGKLKIPVNLLSETKTSLYLLSLSLPIILCAANLRGALEAVQRFDLVNLIRVPASSLILLLPVVGILVGYKLPGIISMVVVFRFVTLIIYLLFCFKVFPLLKLKIAIDRCFFSKLLTFGGWVTLSNVLVPILTTVDRIVIGGLISMAAVTYYSVPCDAVLRLLIVPSAIILTLFPAFSSLSVVDKSMMKQVYVCGLKYTLIVLGPLITGVIVFAGPILSIWIDEEFAAKSSAILQILAVGVLLNGLAQMSAGLLDGINKPDVRAKVFALIVPVYIALLLFFINYYGVVGAALAWTIKACMEFVIFSLVASALIKIDADIFKKEKFVQLISLFFMFSFFSLLMVFFHFNLKIQMSLMACLTVIFGTLIYKYVLSYRELAFLRRVVACR